jgi:hypothetical protein
VSEFIEHVSFRVGRHNPRTIYLDVQFEGEPNVSRFVAVTMSDAAAPEIAASMNNVLMRLPSVLTAIDQYRHCPIVPE